jgi:hypothetical protein
MANELTASGSLVFDDGDTVVSLDVSEFLVTLTTVRFTRVRQQVGTSEEAINLGEVAGASLGWMIAINRDTTNYVELRSATGAGNDVVKLPAGNGFAIFHWGSDVSAPFAIANTAACWVDFLIAQQ